MPDNSCLVAETRELREGHPVSRMRNLKPSFDQRRIGMGYIEPQTDRLHCQSFEMWQNLASIKILIQPLREIGGFQLRIASTCLACVADLRASAIALYVAIRPSFACRRRFSRFSIACFMVSRFVKRNEGSALGLVGARKSRFSHVPRIRNHM